MAKKSLYAQLDAVAVPSRNLKPSPRHWNPGLLRYRGKLWLAYRYHRKETPDARCGIAVTEIDPTTFEPIGQSSRLAFSGPSGTEHHEDCRLFLFRGEPMISFTEMNGYIPGHDYTCVMKYAKLKLTGVRWSVEDEWQPVYGNNAGYSKEKNWIFFEHAEELYCIYSGAPKHIVLKLNGEKVVQEFVTEGPDWQWGHFRGGTPPADLGDGRMMSIFHSSLATEVPPHFVRYYGGAYTFESKPPFRPLQISQMPLMAGSEEDGHKVDPRYVQGWKPFVVFPCGLVPDGTDWLCSLGVNDWQCAVARIKPEHLKLGAADGSDFTPRYYRAANGTIPVKYVNGQQKPEFLHWTIIRRRGVCAVGQGIMKVIQARAASEVLEHPDVEEITQQDFDRMLANARM